MARYIKQEMPDLNGTGETKCYYRLEKRRNLSTKEFLTTALREASSSGRIFRHCPLKSPLYPLPSNKNRKGGRRLTLFIGPYPKEKPWKKLPRPHHTK